MCKNNNIPAGEQSKIHPTLFLRDAFKKRLDGLTSSQTVNDTAVFDEECSEYASWW